MTRIKGIVFCVLYFCNFSKVDQAQFSGRKEASPLAISMDDVEDTYLQILVIF